jgi:rubrerythrin
MEDTREVLKEAIQKNLEELLEEEGWEVGLYLARAERADLDGYPQVAKVIREVAMDEANHLARVVKLMRPDRIDRDVKTNLMAMIEGDTDAAEREREMAKKARAVGMDQEAQLFEWLAEREMGHVEKLKAALRSLEGTPVEEDHGG